MEDLKQFYARLLRIERPWIVIEVRFQEQERVDVYVDHVRGIKLRCPRCDAWCPVYDHSPEREWRHLDTCDVPTYVHTRLPRVQYKIHGVLSIASEWAEPGSDLTRALEAVTGEEYRLKSLDNSGSPVSVTADGEGRLWLIVGTDSGFEGLSAFYYESIACTFTPVEIPGTGASLLGVD